VDHERTEPQRIQLKRTKGWRMPANTMKVDRTTIFGNLFSVESSMAAPALCVCTSFGWSGSCRRERTKRRMVLEALPGLEGKTLGCWCPLPEPGEVDACHAAVLLEFVRKGRRSGKAR
jgi:Domain of unknown function (DUF4326)